MHVPGSVFPRRSDLYKLCNLIIFVQNITQMTKLVLQFDNSDDLIQLLLLLKEHGMEHLAFGPQNKPAKKKPTPGKRKWEGIGAVDLKGKLATISNLRDFAYEE
jgi:hypothetical protein